jgi:hypothetical protein
MRFTQLGKRSRTAGLGGYGTSDEPKSTDGFQLVGDLGSEGALFALAADYERMAPWADL